MERVARVATVSTGVGKRTDHLQELHRRARPAVGKDQREGVRLRRAHMQEVDGLTVDLGRVLREHIQSGLVLAPVVAGTPVFGQVLEIVERNAPAPADARQLIGPASAGQTVVQVVQIGLGNGYFERLDTQVVLLLYVCVL